MSSSEQRSAAPKPTEVSPDSPRFKPHKKLLVVLLCVFVIWVGALLWMYFAIVRPNRHMPIRLPAKAPTTLPTTLTAVG